MAAKKKVAKKDTPVPAPKPPRDPLKEASVAQLWNEIAGRYDATILVLMTRGLRSSYSTDDEDEFKVLAKTRRSDQSAILQMLRAENP
jgi:hypothetical protein